MKPNARLYLPQSVIEEYLVSIGAPKVQPDRQPVASVEQLDGGCLLYQLALHERSASGNGVAFPPHLATD